VMAQALAAGADIRLTLVGWGKDADALEDRARALGLAERVHFPGYLPTADLAECLSRHHVGVCLYTGRAEFTGLKLLDYKAAGLATVAAGEGGEPALIGHLRAGIIVPPDDAGAATRALLQLAADPKLTRELGRRARLEAESGHRWAHTAQALERLFVQLEAPGARAPRAGAGAEETPRSHQRHVSL
jgi:glycosyltransferase involved in cell wall biosynthesis